LISDHFVNAELGALSCITFFVHLLPLRNAGSNGSIKALWDLICHGTPQHQTDNHRGIRRFAIGVPDFPGGQGGFPGGNGGESIENQLSLNDQSPETP
jgi:hypothetical protein